MTLVADKPLTNEALPSVYFDELTSVVAEKENAFAESDALLAQWQNPDADKGWDTVSRAIVDKWTSREREMQDNADYIGGLLSVGVVTEEQFAAFDPSAEVRTHFEATDYSAITAEPTKVKGPFMSWIGHGTKSSYALMDTERWGYFDLRDATHAIHDLTEDVYWGQVKDKLTAKANANPTILENDGALNTALVEAQTEAGALVQMTETEKWGYTGKSGTENLPKEGSLRFKFYSAIKKGIDKVAALKPIARLQVAVGQLQTTFGEAVRNSSEMPVGKRIVCGALGATVISSVVVSGYAMAAGLVPSEADLFQVAAKVVGLDK